MTWLATKEFFKRAWIWIKTYWQVPFLILWTVLVYILTRRNTDALVEVLRIKEDSHKREIEILNKAHKDELIKLKGLQVEYIKTIEDLERKFEQRKETLSEKHIEDVKDIVLESKGNPQEIKKKIEDEFGIKFKD